MGLMLGEVHFRRPPKSRPQIVAEQLGEGYLHWSDALEKLGTRGRGYDTFKRYREGFDVGGVIVRLRVSLRPGGAVVPVAAIGEFINDYAAAVRRGEAERARRDGVRLRLVGRYAGERMLAQGRDDVGTRIDVRA